MSAAFFLDPLKFEEVKPGEFYLPFTSLKVQEVDDAKGSTGNYSSTLIIHKLRLTGKHSHATCM
jgi:hypothetical protein